MTEQNALVPVGQMSTQEIMVIGETMAKSGFFSDAKDAAKAVVKILAGREMGFGPFASMTGISIIQGKPSIGANLMASAVKANPRYDYRIVYLEDDGCELAFFEQGEERGRSAFTQENAAAAGLAGKDNWKKYPRNMYFARALSNGVRWHCPDVFNGNTVYTPEELGAVVDGETGAVIDLEPTIAPSGAATTGTVSLGPVDPSEWDSLKVPDDFTELYSRVHELGLAEESPAGRRKHAANIIKLTYPDNGETAAEAWQAIIDHQRSKLEAAHEEADE